MSFQKLSERQGKHKVEISYSSREDTSQKLKITHVPKSEAPQIGKLCARSGYVKC